MKQTKRYLNLKIETRENENNEKWIVGLIPYNSKSQNLNPNGKPFFEVIEKTAFNKTLGDGQIKGKAKSVVFFLFLFVY